MERKPATSSARVIHVDFRSPNSKPSQDSPAKSPRYSGKRQKLSDVIAQLKHIHNFRALTHGDPKFADVDYHLDKNMFNKTKTLLEAILQEFGDMNVLTVDSDKRVVRVIVPEVGRA